MSRIVVTGMGAISAIGNNVSENRMSLLQGRSGISRLELFNTRYASLLPFGEIKISNNSLQQKLSVTEPGVTRTTLLALHAFEEAVTQAGLGSALLQSFDTALIGASTVGGMCLTDELYHDANATDHGSAYLSSYDCASVNMYLQKRFGITGIINTINTACSSSANAILYGARLITQGLAQRAIVGGTDSLAKFTINGFNALHILSPDACAPFDEERKGLNLGEGAAFLVLEKEEALMGRKALAAVTGYANSNDAFHPSSLSDEGIGPYLSMKGALDKAGLAPEDISFVNAHGTGTENNDLSESRAMQRLFTTVPAFASTKANTGHTLGAAGAIEAVYSILSLAYQEVYAGLNFNKPIPGTALVPVTTYKQMPLQHVMSNSFGFGGNCSSLIFSR
ncbi:MAG TPA: beta-ketoacyl-[acyl-carrier-protein] synthase family protein [Chitinophagaceae bacterium]|nr:beta-ketoacyl-[acyl-carrier-protein] synthase family protein [Chitinophagaceae bacterium]